MKISRRVRFSGSLLILAAIALAAQMPERYLPVMAEIRSKSLEGRLSFLASDELEGRGTPSHGQDVAAEYIASEFRAAGLEPAGDKGYFQTADWQMVRPKQEGLLVRLEAPGHAITLAPDRVEAKLTESMQLDKAPVLLIDVSSPAHSDEMTAEALAGKVVALTGISRIDGLPVSERNGARRRFRALQALLRHARPRVILRADYGMRSRSGQEILVDPELPSTILAPEAREFFAGMHSGTPGITLTLNVPAPESRPVRLRNVAALLKGSDPELSKTYVLLSAHYDHLGMKPDGRGDRIYNGADDDGSGVVSVLEIAAALARSGVHPRRSILFVTYFGEELGLLGSQYYARHPLVPLEQTVANINLEQVGRTDDSIQSRVNEATFTGFDYSTLVPVFEQAGKLTGVHVVRYKDPNSGESAGDPFFARSDNISLASRGVVAHTVCVALEFPDYHRVSDEWPKVDYQNMARVDRMIALGTLMIADSETAPEWNRSNPATQPFQR